MFDFKKTRSLFHLPKDVIYLDGNSLGPLPVAATERVSKMMVEEWGEQLIRGWNSAGWYVQPRKVGDRVARLIGAPAGSVVMGDTLSIKVYQALSAAFELNPERRVVLSDHGNFPSDLYIAQGLIGSLGRGYELKIVAPEDVESSIDHTIAATLITEVDYRTGRRHNMKQITAKAHEAGAIAIWDLAHSAGAVDVDLTGANADLAVGCTYKYLNGGPGAPAFIYVAPRYADQVRPSLSGWMGHEHPFAFDLDYQPAQGIERMRVGTSPVIALAALEAALDAWEGVSMSDVRLRSMELTQKFIEKADAACPGLELASPRDPSVRGSQVSFRHPQAYAVVQALISRGVIGDFRAPDIMRFGFTPLYLSMEEVEAAVDILAHILKERLWDQPEYYKKAAVT